MSKLCGCGQSCDPDFTVVTLDFEQVALSVTKFIWGTAVAGNFDAITVKQADPTDNVGFRIGEPAPDDDDDDVASASGTPTSAPKV